jgi:uncharacterized protein (DUF58 family)
VPPSTRHLQLMLHTLGRARASGAGKLSAAIERLTHLTTRAGIVVLVSDCYEPVDDIGRAVDALRVRGHDVILFHLVDAGERDFPFSGATTFEDAESGIRLPLRPDDLRDRYLQQMRAHHVAVAARLASSGTDYLRVETDKPLDGALHAYLDARLARSRVR